MARKRSVRSSATKPQTSDGERPARFGKAATENSGHLTDMGCPDCTGVLAYRGFDGHLAFACSIGHRFSAESLVEAKEEQLEGALWNVVELYGELILVHRELAGRARAEGQKTLARGRERRAARAEGLRARLKNVLARDAVAPERARS
jgi:two-component system, chemotaxis family, protein-glutamate methylesterase/glutaminase